MLEREIQRWNSHLQHPKTTMAIHRKQPRAMCQPLALLFTIKVKELIVQYKGRGPINQQASLFIVICKYFLIHSRYNCHRQGVAEVKLSPNGIITHLIGASARS
jgi:hypothetical protein